MEIELLRRIGSFLLLRSHYHLRLPNLASQRRLDFVALLRIRGNGMKKKKNKVQGDFIEENGEGKQRTGGGDKIGHVALPA